MVRNKSNFSVFYEGVFKFSNASVDGLEKGRKRRQQNCRNGDLLYYRVETVLI